jgi:WH1 domain
VVINSAVFKELKYQKLSETFHNWADTKRTYGLNFASDAEVFCDTMNDCIEKLKGVYLKELAGGGGGCCLHVLVYALSVS